jgi:poly-beta-1,6-N-acetyl-D-glucosamine synthase
MPRKINISIGVFAYNEEKNIKNTLESISNQKTDLVDIKEVLVVSSGSNDKTNNIVRQMAKKSKRLKLLIQFERQGKSSAINLFITKSKTQILVSVSSDLKLKKDAIEEICLPFLEKNIGMVGAHPVPSNLRYSQIGKEIGLLWKLHHFVSLQHPKCGEVVAFRKVIKAIPKESAVDEATIEVLLRLIGYKIVYAPRSIVYNKAPKTINEFLTQRRRVYAGHKWVNIKYNYQVSTLKNRNSFEAVIQYLSSNPQDTLTMINLIFLESVGRLLGWIDFFVLNKNPYVWKMVDR